MAMRQGRLLAGFGALLLLAGCGGEPAPQTEGAGRVTDTVTVPDGQGGKTTATVQEKDDQTTVTFSGDGGEGSITVGGGAAPRDLPAYAPVYPGATILSTMSGRNEEGGGGMVTLESADAPGKVLAFYEGKIAGAGLSQTAKAQSSAGATLSASDTAAGRDVQISITAGPDGGSIVTIAYSNPTR